MLTPTVKKMLVNFHQNCLLFLHGNVWMTASYISEVIFSQEKFRIFWETTWGLNPENHHRSTAKAENRNWLHDISIILKIMKKRTVKATDVFFLKQSERDEEKWGQTSESLGGKWYKKYPKILHPKINKKKLFVGLIHHVIQTRQTIEIKSEKWSEAKQFLSRYSGLSNLSNWSKNPDQPLKNVRKINHGKSDGI